MESESRQAHWQNVCRRNNADGAAVSLSSRMEGVATSGRRILRACSDQVTHLQGAACMPAQVDICEAGV